MNGWHSWHRWPPTAVDTRTSKRSICLQALGLAPHNRLAPLAPLLARLLVGTVMATHGFGKLVDMTPAGFGQNMLGGMLGLPVPVALGWAVTLIELVGGILLIVGAFSRIAALLNLGVLLGALALVRIEIGLIAPMGADMPGAELEFGLIAGLLTVMLLGPGKPSVDHLIGVEHGAPSVEVRELGDVPS